MHQTTLCWLRQALEILSLASTCYGILAAPLAPDAASLSRPATVASSSNMQHGLQPVSPVTDTAFYDRSVEKGKVVAVDNRRGLFALWVEEGKCSVFSQYSGPEIHSGDVLTGRLADHGVQTLDHVSGSFQALFRSGPVTLADAIAIVKGPRKA